MAVCAELEDLDASLDKSLRVGWANHTGAALAVEVLAMMRSHNKADAAQVAAMAAFEGSGEWRAEGYLSAAAALAFQTRGRRATEAKSLWVGRQLRTMPFVSEAFAAGDL